VPKWQEQTETQKLGLTIFTYTVYELQYHFRSNDWCVLCYRLTLSKELGDMIYQHCVKDTSCPAYIDLLSLAHDVYSDCSAHVDAMLCLVKQNRIHSAMQYALVTQECTPQHLIEVYSSDVKSSRTSWPRGQIFGLGLGLEDLSRPRPRAFGLGLSSNFLFWFRENAWNDYSGIGNHNVFSMIMY